MTAQAPRGDTRGAILRAVVGFLAFLGLYLLFAGEVSSHELLAGIPAAAALAGFALALGRARQRQLRLHTPWPRLLLRPLAALLVDTVRVGRVLASSLLRRPVGPVGIVARQPFREHADEPTDAGRRALVTLGASLAPNGYVLAIEPDALILHRLAPAAPAADEIWPL